MRLRRTYLGPRPLVPGRALVSVARLVSLGFGADERRANHVVHLQLIVISTSLYRREIKVLSRYLSAVASLVAADVALFHSAPARRRARAPRADGPPVSAKVKPR